MLAKLSNILIYSSTFLYLLKEMSLLHITYFQAFLPVLVCVVVLCIVHLSTAIAKLVNLYKTYKSKKEYFLRG